MKTSEEMVKSLLERRTQYYTEKSIKKQNAVKLTVTFAVCLTIITSAMVAVPSIINNKTVILPSENRKTTVYSKSDTTVYIKSETTALKTQNINNTTSKIINETTALKTQNVDNTTSKIINETTFPEKNNTTKHQETTHHSNDKGVIKISPFISSPKDPDSDYFGEDELEHIDIILNGNRLYKQFSESEYKYYGIENTLKKSDFGEFIGTIKEIGSYSDSAVSAPCSQEPTLNGCEVYFYKPVNCEAIIIVYGNDHCSLFRFSCFTKNGFSFADEYKVFNVSSSDDIERVDYTVRIPEGSLIVKTAEGNISAETEINSFFSITKKLKSYTHNTLTGSPEWLNDAREKHKQLNENKQIYIEASVILKNGLSMSLSYQPNLGTGYIPGHFFLSESDNATMKKLFEIL